MTSRKITKKSSAGFTLVEIMITLAIAVILITLAVPSFSLMINNSKVTSSTNEFVASLNLARSEALKRSNNISVCKSNPAYSACAGSGSVASYTTNGWLVATDCNSDGILNNTGCPTGVTDVILKVGESNKAIDMNVQMDYVTYNLSGRIVGGGVPTFIVETNTSNTSIKKNKIKINRIGRVKTCKVGETGC